MTACNGNLEVLGDVALNDSSPVLGCPLQVNASGFRLTLCFIKDVRQWATGHKDEAGERVGLPLDGRISHGWYRIYCGLPLGAAKQGGEGGPYPRTVRA